MTLPRKGTRLITVDGKQYRYMIKAPRKCYRDDDAVFLLIQEAVSRNAGNILSVPTDLIITPKLVKEYIRYGIEHGWEPHEKGLPVNLKFLNK